VKKILTVLVLLATAATASAQLRASPSTQPAPKAAPPSPVVPPPAVILTPQDNRNTSAKQIGERVKAADAQVVELSKELLAPVEAVRASEKLTELRRVDELRKRFKLALVSIHGLDEMCIQLDRELRHATNAYDAAGKAFRDRAEDYTDGKLKEACLSWAAYYDRLKEQCPAHRKRLADLRKEIPATILLIRESGSLMDDYSLFVSTYEQEIVPDNIAGIHLTAIKDYSKKFESFEKALAAYKK
jgi:hypothetical protein